MFLTSETKLDDSFPTPQFPVSNGGGLLLCITEDIPSKILMYSSNCDIETLLVEINLRKRKWLLIIFIVYLLISYFFCTNFLNFFEKW